MESYETSPLPGDVLTAPRTGRPLAHMRGSHRRPWAQEFLAWGSAPWVLVPKDKRCGCVALALGWVPGSPWQSPAAPGRALPSGNGARASRGSCTKATDRCHLPQPSRFVIMIKGKKNARYLPPSQLCLLARS